MNKIHIMTMWVKCFKTMDTFLILLLLPHIHFCVRFSSFSLTPLFFILEVVVCPNNSSYSCQYIYKYILHNTFASIISVPKLNHKIAKQSKYTFQSIYIRVGEQFKRYLDQFMHMTRTVYIQHYVLVLCVCLHFMAVFI